MMNTIINFIGLFILFYLIMGLLQKIFPGLSNRTISKSQKKKLQDSFAKADNDRLGRRFLIPRDEKQGVKVNLYLNEATTPLPLVVVCHGGALIDGDADQMDSFCHRMKTLWNAQIVSVNYTKLNEQKIPWQQDEVVDTVKYMLKNCSEYMIDGDKIAMVGFSGGAYIQTGAAVLLNQQGINVKGLIQFYPLIDDSIINLTDSNLIHSKVRIITCNNEEMNKRCNLWLEHLNSAGVDGTILPYPDAMQGFIEYSNPEFKDDPRFKKNLAMFDESQENMARACEIRVGGLLNEFFEGEIGQ